MISMFRPALTALLTTLALFAATPALAQEARPQQTLASPDGSIVLTVSTDTDARPLWLLYGQCKLLTDTSMLGFLFNDGIRHDLGIAIEGPERVRGGER